MTAYSALCAGVLFPLHERLKGHDSVAVRRRLEASQWGSPEQIAADQLLRLRDYLTSIGARVPYYRQLFKALSFDPRQVREVKDLRCLPLLTKAIVRANTDALKADDHGILSRFNTGGSSGEPLVFFIGKDRISHDVAAKWRATRWWGVDIGDTEGVVWGSPIELGAQDRLRRLRDGVMRSHLLPAFEMSEAKLDGFITTLQRLKPRMLFGYPSALNLIADHAQKRGQRLDNLGVRVVFVTSERLYDEQRQAISAAFGCQVANGYGGRDAGFVAHECPSGGMHLMAEDIVVEFLDSQGQPVGDGQAGEIVVTHLASREFPFLRYRTGDIAVMDTRRCACGRGLPMLREIQGRSTDFLIAADGTVMHGLSLIYILRDLPGVGAFKITQTSRTQIGVEIVVEAGFDPACETDIVLGFRKRLGADVLVEVRRVAQIAPEKSGKFRYVISHAI